LTVTSASIGNQSRGSVSVTAGFYNLRFAATDTNAWCMFSAALQYLSGFLVANILFRSPVLSIRGGESM
jgi:hypothetical protein